MIFSGKVHNVVYENEDFKILKFMLDGAPQILTVKGRFPVQSTSIGSWVCFEGDMVQHPQYGQQINVTTSFMCLVVGEVSGPIWRQLTSCQKLV